MSDTKKATSVANADTKADVKTKQGDKDAKDSKSAAALDDHLVLRPLEEGDYEKGFLTILAQLTTVGEMTKQQFIKRFQEQQAAKDHYFVIVIEDTIKQKIIATSTLLMERKYVHRCGMVGHVEDVVVNETYRGKRLGLRVVDACKKIAKDKGCYKVILDCSEKNVVFYEKLGFKLNENHLACYF